MVKGGEVVDDLIFKGQAAGNPDKFRLRQEPIVEPHPAPDAKSRPRKPKPGNHNKVDKINRHRFAFNRSRTPGPVVVKFP